jgi:hypothetical protein
MQKVKLTKEQLGPLLKYGQIISDVKFWQEELDGYWEFKLLDSGVWLRPVSWGNWLSNGIFLGRTETEAMEIFKSL